MTVKNVTIPTIKAFCNLEPKAQALKPLEEAAEVFGAWQNIDRMSAKFVNVDEEIAETMCALERDLMDDIADCIQACANLAAMVGVSDLTECMERCEQRNRERGRYGD